MTGLSLFTGIGGLDFAFELAGGHVTAMCEIDPFCRSVLRKHWPDVPIFEDVTKLRGEDVGAVDVIFGGFPCQPFSVAGDQKGRDDDRYLWPEFSRMVAEIKPRWVVAENVPGILSIAGDSVCTDLERQGYNVGIWDFEAAAVGAPHRRARIFFVAYSKCGMRKRGSCARNIQTENGGGMALDVERSSGTSVPDAKSIRRDVPCITQSGEHKERERERTAGRLYSTLADADGTRKLQQDRNFAERWERAGNGCETSSDADCTGSQGRDCEGLCKRTGERLIGASGTHAPDANSGRYKSREKSLLCGGESRTCNDCGRKPEPRLGGVADGFSSRLDGYWRVEPDIPRVAKGIPNRVQRLKALGNAVVPAQAKGIFDAIIQADYEGERDDFSNANDLRS